MSSRRVTEVARPFISADKREAKLRALLLYKQWMRHADWIANVYQNFLYVNNKMVKQKIREEFAKNRDVTDLRVIDILLNKGQNDLREVSAQWIQQCHIMGRWWKDTVPEQPNSFMEKFVKGSD